MFISLCVEPTEIYMTVLFFLRIQKIDKLLNDTAIIRACVVCEVVNDCLI